MIHKIKNLKFSAKVSIMLMLSNPVCFSITLVMIYIRNYFPHFPVNLHHFGATNHFLTARCSNTAVEKCSTKEFYSKWQLSELHHFTLVTINLTVSYQKHS